MTQTQVFAALLLLKSPARAESILALVDKEKLDSIREAIQELGGLPESELRQRWQEARAREERVHSQTVRQKLVA